MPATAISAFDATFAQGLLEAAVQLAAGADAVLLVAYDSASAGPLAQVVVGEKALTPGDLLGGPDLETLPGLDGADEVGRVVQIMEGTGV